MAEKEQVAQRKHTLHTEARLGAQIDGVLEVVSFDEQSVVLRTACGELIIEGDGLHVSTLDMAQGVVALEGTVSAFLYAEDMATKKGLRKRR